MSKSGRQLKRWMLAKTALAIICAVVLVAPGVPSVALADDGDSVRENTSESTSDQSEGASDQAKAAYSAVESSPSVVQEPADIRSSSSAEQPRNVSSEQEQSAISPMYSWSGAGTSQQPYQITSMQDLVEFREAVNEGESYAGVYFVLTQDIALSGSWTPIGLKSTAPFSGHFDGSGHSITGLDVSLSDATAAAGLFGYVGTDSAQATLSNLSVYGSVVSTAGSSGVGGLVGSASFVDISQCINHATVKGFNYAGGLVGSSVRSNISDSGNYGAVTSTFTSSGSAGGLVGYFGTGSLATSYNRGVVSGRYGGGLVGLWALSYMDGTVGALNSCYSIGELQGTEKGRGALVGWVSKDTGYSVQNTVVNCFGNADLSGTTTLFGSEYAYRANEGVAVDDASSMFSDAAMRTAEFAQTLGSNFKASLDYPVLAWEQGDGLPVITAQPQAVSCDLGASNIQVSVSARLPQAGFTGWAGELSYQWYKAADETPSSDDTLISGATSANYTIDTSQAYSAYYYCVVTNTFDGSTPSVISESAQVIIRSAVQASDPSFGSYETSYTFAQSQGNSQTVKVQVETAAQGVGVVTYQWQVSDSSDGVFADVNEAGATGTVPEGGVVEYAPDCKTMGTLYYRCVVTNTFEGATRSATTDPISVEVGAAIVVSDEADLLDFSQKVNSGQNNYEGLVVKLSGDIASTGAWTPIGTLEHPFKGTFDGSGYSVTLNDTASPSSDYRGLFGVVENAAIKDVVIKGTVTGAHYVGGAVAYAGTGTTVSRVGNEADITADYAENSLADVEWGTGGVVGQCAPGSTVDQCYNRGTITAPYYIGGVVGFAQSQNNQPVALTSLYNTGTVAASGAAVGGILGSFYKPGSTEVTGLRYGTLENCYNAGKVELSTSFTSAMYGGICGSASYEQPDYSGNYYLSGSLLQGGEILPDQGCADQAATEVTALETLTMLESTFVDTLGSAYQADSFDQNGGFPLLVWESLKSAPVCTYTVTIKPAEASFSLTDSIGRTKAPVRVEKDDLADTVVYIFSLLAGDYSYQATPADSDAYLPEKGSFTIDEMQNDSVGSRSISLIGSHFDAQFSVQASDGVTPENVVISATHQETERTYTTDAAHGYNLSLLPGEYSYTVSSDNCNTASGTMSIDDAAITVPVSLVPCASVSFSVTAQTTSTPITNATCVILMQDENATALTAQPDGSFCVPDGAYDYRVGAAGYNTLSGSLLVENGIVVQQDGALASPSQRIYTLSAQLEILSLWDGTEESEPFQDESGVYLISSAQELAWFAHYVNENPDEDGFADYDAKLVADIFLNQATGDNRWNPIGYYRSDNDASWYSGTFDGQGHLVNGLLVIGGNYQGLFGAVSEATIKNVEVSGMVRGSNYVGGLVGYAYGPFTLSNCGNYATVYGACAVGGLLGYHSETGQGSVSGCFNKGAVNSTVATTMTGDESSVGGIAGSGYAIDFNSCYNTGTITANGFNEGGIAGSSWSNTTFAYCYNTGQINSSFTSETESYATSIGAIVGGFYVSDVSVAANCYWLSSTAPRGVGSSDSVVVVDASTPITSPSGLLDCLNASDSPVAFSAVSNESFNAGYPRLTWEIERTTPTQPAPTQDGSSEHPWEIGSYAELLEFEQAIESGRTYAGEYVVLTNDITVDGSFDGIGGTYFPFAGTFDGRGHCISGLAIDTGSEYAGLFQYLRGATVKQLEVEGSVAGTDFVGGLAGYAYVSTVQDCLVKVDVTLNQSADVIAAGSVGGVVGRAYRDSLVSNVFDGEVMSTNPNARISAICSYGTSDAMNLSANYYLVSDSDDATGAFSGSDVDGQGQGVDSLDSDELAWLLNTADETRLNTSLWGNASGVAFADGLAIKAVYRIYVDSTGITVDLSQQYATQGQIISYTDFASKKGFTLSGGALVTKIGTPEVLGDVLKDTTGASSGTFAQVDTDVRFSALTTFDPSTSFTVTYQVVSNDEIVRTATVQSVSSAVEKTPVDVRISDIDSASRFVSVEAHENDRDGASVNLDLLGFGEWYRFVMPRADVLVTVTLDDSAAEPENYWASEEIENAAKHINSETYTSDAAYCTSLLTLDSDKESGISTYDNPTYPSQWYLGLEDVEGSYSDRYQYRGSYSILDNQGNWFTQDYQGFLLYDYLVGMLGMPDNLSDDKTVTLSNDTGESVTLTMGQLRSKSYRSYETDKTAENYGYATTEGMPVMLAYAEASDPIKMDVRYSGSYGAVIRYDQKTPYMLVVGQNGADDANMKFNIGGIDTIVVGDCEPSDQHSGNVYDGYLDEAVTVNLYQGDETVPSKTVSLTVAEIEQYYNESYKARERSLITGSQFVSSSVIGDGQVNALDYYDGVDLYSLLLEKAGLDAFSADDLIAQESKATFYSSSSQGVAEVCTVPMEYLAGGKDATFADNAVDYGGLTLKGVRSLIAFSKNGYPLVFDASYPGYIEDTYNRYGPLMAVLPYNVLYGVQGYVDPEEGAYVNDAKVVCFLDRIDVRIPAPTEAEVVRLFGETAVDTAVDISSEAFPGDSEWAVLARADDFADAMSATGLAGMLGAPIMLTERTELSEATLNKMKDLNVKKVLIIGGEGAILPAVQSRLEREGFSTSRVFGTQACDTSVECAKRLADLKQSAGEACDTAIVASSFGFQDALSISSFAYTYHVPILLETNGATSADRNLTSEAVSLLQKGSFWSARVYVPGGSGAVSTESVEGVLGFSRIAKRIFGETGYDTSQEIAAYFVENKLLSASTVCIANGASAPKGVDALAGSALAGSLGGVLLLVNDNETFGGIDTNAISGFLTAHADEVNHAYILGGTAVVSSDTFARVEDLVLK